MGDCVAQRSGIGVGVWGPRCVLRVVSKLLTDAYFQSRPLSLLTHSGPETVPPNSRPSRQTVDRTARNRFPSDVVRTGPPSLVAMLSICRDNLEYLPVLASLPAEQTIFEYLVGCWKRGNKARSELLRKVRGDRTDINCRKAISCLGVPPSRDSTGREYLRQASRTCDQLHRIDITRTRDVPPATKVSSFLSPLSSLTERLRREVGPAELLGPLLSLSSLSAPLLSTPVSSPNQLSPTEVEPLLQDIVKRFEPENELDGVLGPVVRALLFHESLFRREGLAGSDSGWRRVIAGLEALVSIKPIAIMITRLDEWNPESATAANIERVSLMGPLCRLNVFGHEWPTISETYFGDLDRKSRADVESSTASLRGTLKSLQVRL